MGNEKEPRKIASGPGEVREKQTGKFLKGRGLWWSNTGVLNAAKVQSTWHK